jgi:hypothetical protein
MTWDAVSLPAGVGILRAIACNSASCLAAGTPSTATTGFVATGGQLVGSANGETTWQILPTAVPDDAFGIACPDAKVCVVVGTDWVGTPQPQPRGGIAATMDGGSQWQPASLKYVPVGMSSVACPTVNRCVAVGGNVLVRVSLPSIR